MSNSKQYYQLIGKYLDSTVDINQKIEALKEFSKQLIADYSTVKNVETKFVFMPVEYGDVATNAHSYYENGKQVIAISTYFLEKIAAKKTSICKLIDTIGHELKHVDQKAKKDKFVDLPIEEKRKYDKRDRKIYVNLNNLYNIENNYTPENLANIYKINEYFKENDTKMFRTDMTQIFFEVHKIYMKEISLSAYFNCDYEIDARNAGKEFVKNIVNGLISKKDCPEKIKILLREEYKKMQKFYEKRQEIIDGYLSSDKYTYADFQNAISKIPLDKIEEIYLSLKYMNLKVNKENLFTTIVAIAVEKANQKELQNYILEAIENNYNNTVKILSKIYNQNQEYHFDLESKKDFRKEVYRLFNSKLKTEEEINYSILNFFDYKTVISIIKKSKKSDNIVILESLTQALREKYLLCQEKIEKREIVFSLIANRANAYFQKYMFGLKFKNLEKYDIEDDDKKIQSFKKTFENIIAIANNSKIEKDLREINKLADMVKQKKQSDIISLK